MSSGIFRHCVGGRTACCWAGRPLPPSHPRPPPTIPVAPSLPQHRHFPSIPKTPRGRSAATAEGLSPVWSSNLGAGVAMPRSPGPFPTHAVRSAILISPAEEAQPSLPPWPTHGHLAHPCHSPNAPKLHSCLPHPSCLSLPVVWGLVLPQRLSLWVTLEFHPSPGLEELSQPRCPSPGSPP